MTTLQDIVDEQVATGAVPGAVALVADADEITVAAGGVRAVGGDPMTRDSLFRIASITKPITAAATMALVERGRFGLDDPVSRWLPELAEPVVLRTVSSALDDVVPAVRPITVRHLLTSQGGHGFPSDFAVPVVGRLLDDLAQGPPRPQERPPTDEWMARLARIPLLHQPGEGWTYNTSSDILGVLLARAEGTSLDDVFADTVLEPLTMADTGFSVAPEDLDRMTACYRRDDHGDLEQVDPPDGHWAAPPPFASGAGGLVSTVDDWAAFGRMLLARGEHRGRRVLAPESVDLMLTSHVEAEPDSPFLEGQGWGFGGSVDLTPTDPWNVPGRYGWVGGTGTAGYVIPSRGVVTVWLGQVEMEGPDDFRAIAAFLTWAAQR
ncbi:beta-lactamase family protein [Iamia sp. SCSIO 61187]|uniref:serine hydrolase domain-containing protein n=1 Tax=Iamia sp. SCSIO 61187 TaxID=2722752 RepID=UPI001C62AC0A|nr:serine hydrolase domain-containing protein [Iamia sp. SCSIO 61187]QYG93574.1 beta-lactamase family protein [Iamia sp. SCSIO 61187]